MFIAVAKSSIKSLQLYAIFLPAFSLLFYILLRDPDDDRDPPDFNKFPTLGDSMIKTIVMSAGEFDVANIDFDFNTFGAYVFVGFVFLISTVFMNLLNGLAVSDTQKIQAKAELTSFIRRCQVLARYEEVLSRKQHWFRYVCHVCCTVKFQCRIFWKTFLAELNIVESGDCANLSHISTHSSMQARRYSSILTIRTWYMRSR